MEQEPQNEEPAEIKIIREAYKNAFLFVNKGLNTDELGQKEEAKNNYKQGIGHLLRGISIITTEPQHTGPGWDSARQMQQKMKETLQNVRARLEILEKGLATSLQKDLQEVPKLQPEFPPKDIYEKSREPQSFNSPQHTEINDNTATTSSGPTVAPSS
ncbi:spartin-like, partial [Octodon degus]|uniref:Spartin n=1 Tax=Octodon degus TaxID=10160 RepID=A0A6P6EEU8_OCTDE